MKYCTLRACYAKTLISCCNFRKALIRIGELDPFDIKRTNLKRNRILKKEHGMTEKDYLNRGILTVRRYLNGNMRKNGKYSNKMIRLTSTVCQEFSKTEKKPSGYYKVKLPKKDYIKISLATYTLLFQNDRKLCDELLKDTHSDSIDTFGKDAVYTVAPIQTDIVRRSTGRTEEIQAFILFTRSAIYGRNKNG